MRKLELRPWTSIGTEEINAATRMVERASAQYYENTGLQPHPLSGFLGGQLRGGAQVEALEREWCETFGAVHAVSVNSATSGLLIALKACGVGPGDEVIVSPFSMSAGVAAVMWCGATPVFADIDDEDYGLSSGPVLDVITKKSRAILVTNLFGRVPDIVDNLNDFGSSVPTLIEDNAQG